MKLSKRGRTVAEQAFREDMAAEKRLLECFDDQEKAVLSNLLSRLVTHLDQEDKSK